MAIYGLPSLSEWYRICVYPYIMPVGFGIGHIGKQTKLNHPIWLEFKYTYQTYALLISGRVGSVFVTMSVTIERYLAIVHPLKHFAWKRYLLVIPIVSSILYNIPKFFELERKVRNDGSHSPVFERTFNVECFFRISTTKCT